MIKSKGNCALLEVMKMEKNLKQNWTDEQIEHLAVTRLRQGQVEQALQYMGIQKLLNRIERYAGCRYESACLRAQERIRHMAVTYMDYLGMRLSLGYDLTNTVYQQPRDLEAAHNKMAAEQNKKEADKRLQEVKRNLQASGTATGSSETGISMRMMNISSGRQGQRKRSLWKAGSCTIALVGTAISENTMTDRPTF